MGKLVEHPYVSQHNLVPTPNPPWSPCGSLLKYQSECLTVVVVGLPARPHFLLLRVVVVGQLVQVVFDSLEHQVSRDLFRTARGNILSFSEVVGILELGIFY